MITILDNTIEVLEVLLVLDLFIPLLLYVALLSLSLLAVSTCRWGPSAPESTSPVGSWSADLSRQHLRWLDLSDSYSASSPIWRSHSIRARSPRSGISSQINIVKQSLNNIKNADNISRANWSYLDNKGKQKSRRKRKAKQDRNPYLPICRIKTKATKSLKPGTSLK
jgi:hypothetical protein